MDQGIVSTTADASGSQEQGVMGSAGMTGSSNSKKSKAPSVVLPEELVEAIAITTVDEITRSYEVTVPIAVIEDAVSRQVDKKTATARIKGFRPGKAPKEMVKRFYSEGLRSEAVYAAIEEVIKAVRVREQFVPYGSPKVDISAVPPVEDLKFSVVVTLHPTPTVSGYAGLSVKAEKHEVTAEELSRALLEYQKSKAVLTDIEGRVISQNGDVAECFVRELAASDEGTTDEGSEPGERMVVALGDKDLPEEFEAELVGMTVGEPKVVELKNKAEKDADDAEAEIAPRRFRVTIAKLSSRQLPELTDEFAQSLTVKDVTTLEELKTSTSARLEQGAAKRTKDELRNAILEKLSELNTFMVPAEMVDSEIRRFIRASGIFNNASIPQEDFDISLFREAFAPEAERRIKKAIIVDRIASQEQLVPSTDEVTAFVAERAEQYNVPVDVAQRFFFSEDRAASTFQDLISEKVMNYLEEQAVVEAA
jgi:trigger factor